MLKEFKNGNLHVNLKNEYWCHTLIETIYCCFDLHPINDRYNIGNDCIAIDLCYNGGSNYYRLTSYDMKKLKEYKTIVLHPLDEQYIKEYILNNEE